MCYLLRIWRSGNGSLTVSRTRHCYSHCNSVAGGHAEGSKLLVCPNSSLHHRKGKLSSPQSLTCSVTFIRSIYNESSCGNCVKDRVQNCFPGNRRSFQLQYTKDQKHHTQSYSPENSEHLRCNTPKVYAKNHDDIVNRAFHIGQNACFLWNKNRPKVSNFMMSRNFSSKADDPDVYDFQKDPEVAAWLKEIGQDFKSEKASLSDIESLAVERDSSSSSESDSDSSPDSDSDSEVETATYPKAEVQVLEANSHTKLDITWATLSDTNVDGTVQEEEEELIEDEEYEDFYHEYEDIEESVPGRVLPISLERGTSGVYDVEELVTLLREENARDVCVIAIPKEYKYVDHMVIVTGRSTRHLKAMAELIKWAYKRKQAKRDRASVKIEGELTKDWMALDLGNIAVHLFLEKTRAKYDLETLWTVGADFDSQAQEEEDPFALFINQIMPHGDPQTQTETKQPTSPKLPESKSMESVAGWHGQPYNPHQ